ncbi:MAG: hypothetical protein R3C05_13385 [Pirellulaceae bacterium]
MSALVASLDSYRNKQLADRIRESEVRITLEPWHSIPPELRFKPSGDSKATLTEVSRQTDSQPLRKSKRRTTPSLNQISPALDDLFGSSPSPKNRQRNRHHSSTKSLGDAQATPDANEIGLHSTRPSEILRGP